VFVSPDNYWHAWFMGTLVIILNPQRFEHDVASKGIAKPKTWDDLLNPVYAKSLVSGNPASCGGAYIFLAVQIFRNGGEEQGFEWLKRYDKQILQYTPTCPAGITLVARGEAIGGMNWQDDATVTEHVRRLRAKLGAAGCPSDFIRTVRGFGYLVADD